MQTDLHFSSKSNEWMTPKWLFNQLDNEFHFDLDAAATKENALCNKFFTQEDDALNQDWAAQIKTGRRKSRLLGVILPTVVKLVNLSRKLMKNLLKE